MSDFERKSAFVKKLEDLQTLLKKHHKASPKFAALIPKIEDAITTTNDQLLVIAEGKEDVSEKIGKVEHEFGDSSFKGYLDGDNQSVGVIHEHENEEKGTSITTDLSTRGIVLGASKELASVEVDFLDIKAGFLRFEGNTEASATLTIGQTLLKDKVGVEASFDLEGSLSLEAYISFFDILEFGGNATIELNGSMGASIFIEKEKVTVKDTTFNITAKFSLFLRPSDTVVEVIEAVSEILEIEGKKKHDFDKDEMGWKIPLAEVPIVDFVVPGFEFEFDAPKTKISPSFDFKSVIEKEKDNLDGFAGTIVDIVEAINDIYEFLDDVWSDIESFFDELGDRFEEAAEELIMTMYPELEGEIKAKRRQEAINTIKSQQIAIIIGGAIEKMKKQPHHVREIYKRETEGEKNWYIFMNVWPDVAADPFVVQSLKALGNDDIQTLEKNSRITEATFSIEQYDFSGPMLEDMHIMGDPIDIAVDVRKDESWVQDVKDMFLKDSALDVKLNAQVKATLLCGTQEVAKKTIAVAELIEDDTPMSNVYNLTIPTPTADKGFTDSTEQDWFIQIKLDFVGNIMDIEENYPIRVTYQQAEDHSYELQQSIMYPEVQGLSIKGKKSGKYFEQGQDLNVITKVGIEMLPPDVEALEGKVIVALTCNKKMVGSNRASHFKLVDHDNPSNIVKISLPLPQGHDETAMGGDWIVMCM